MRPTFTLLFRQSPVISYLSHNEPPLIVIKDATFHRHHPSNVEISNPPLFPRLNFELASYPSPPQHWAVVGPASSGKTTFLEILRGQHLCFPPTARSYPYAKKQSWKVHASIRNPIQDIQYVGFNDKSELGGLSTRGAYLGARYESRREETQNAACEKPRRQVLLLYVQ
jgi:hypothetical protein